MFPIRFELQPGEFAAHEIILSQLADSILLGSEPPVSAEEGREAVRVLNMVVENIETKFATKTA